MSEELVIGADRFNSPYQYLARICFRDTSINAEFLGEGEHAKDTADADFAFMAMKGLTEGAELRSRASSARQQLHGGDGSFLGMIAAMKTMAASLLQDMLAEKRMGFGIDNADVKRIPLDIDLRSNPGRRAWRHAVISGIDFNAPIQVHNPHAILVIPERLNRQS